MKHKVNNAVVISKLKQYLKTANSHFSNPHHSNDKNKKENNNNKNNNNNNNNNNNKK